MTKHLPQKTAASSRETPGARSRARWSVLLALCAISALSFECSRSGTTQSSTVGETPDSAVPQMGGGNGVDAASDGGPEDAGAAAVLPEAAVVADDGPEVESTDAGHADATAEVQDAAESTSAAYAPCSADGGPCKILPFGDSITYGLQYAGGYRVQLFQDALTGHKNITFVGDPSLANGPATVSGVPFPQDNQGHSGWTIDELATLVPSPALQPNPDIILLLIGTNDMYSQTQPVAQAPERLGVLIDKIIAAAPQSLLVVAQITPLANSAWEMQVETYNLAIPALIHARATAGKHIAMVDMHTGFQVSTMLSSDGVHPNETGYNHMGDVWYAAISAVLP
jgi:lysophospholipase L1-like esterase